MFDDEDVLAIRHPGMARLDIQGVGHKMRSWSGERHTRAESLQRGGTKHPIWQGNETWSTAGTLTSHVHLAHVKLSSSKFVQHNWSLVEICSVLLALKTEVGIADGFALNGFAYT